MIAGKYLLSFLRIKFKYLTARLILLEEVNFVVKKALLPSPWA